ncbi:TetR family transcriptional regulator [Nocardia sp. NPDC057272]|uniref:TetR family transcriptional regulator n=1 Tax=Nocardia sp. NPDC057272 TaxID=3346079 RepID=UPI003625CECE
MAIKDLREVSRSAIRARVAEVAEEMFLADGFESTTVDAIAAAVGMSQRTFFRYFPSKDDLVLHNFEQLGENLSERLTRRPPEESDWVALRHSFDVVAEQFSDPHRRARGLMIQQIIDNSTALLPGYLEKIARIQHRLAAVLQARRLATAPDAHVDDALLHALIGAAFACLQAVVSEAANSTEGTDFVARLDSIMSAIHPEPGR